MIRGIAFTGIYYVLSFLFIMACLPLLALPGRGAVSWMIRQYTRAIRFTLHWMGGIRIEIRGRENLPDGPFIIAAKHQSWGDGFVVYPEIDNLAFVTGDHLERFPFVGGILRKLGAIIIDTCGGGDRKARSLADGMEVAKRNGRRILIYPEGHLAPPGFHFRYKPGVWHMQKAMNVPVIPVATNLGLFWQQEAIRKKTGTAVIEFLEPIETGLTKAGFLAELENRIEEKCARLLTDRADAATRTTWLPDPVRPARQP